jgi:hypothetical protein
LRIESGAMKYHRVSTGKGLETGFELQQGEKVIECGCVINFEKKTVAHPCSIHREWCDEERWRQLLDMRQVTIGDQTAS